jgi:hypothetical protein
VSAISLARALLSLSFRYALMSAEPRDGELGESVELTGAEEHQVLRLGGRVRLPVLDRGGLALGNLGLQTGGRDDLGCDPQRCVPGQRGVEAGDPGGEDLYDLPCPYAEFARIQQVLVAEVGAGGPLPRLAGDTGPRHSPVHRGLGRTGVVTVEVAGRDGLQGVHVEEDAVHEASLSVSEVMVVPAAAAVAEGGCLPSLALSCQVWKERPHSLRTVSAPPGRCQV